MRRKFSVWVCRLLLLENLHLETVLVCRQCCFSEVALSVHSMLECSYWYVIYGVHWITEAHAMAQQGCKFHSMSHAGSLFLFSLICMTCCSYVSIPKFMPNMISSCVALWSNDNQTRSHEYWVHTMPWLSDQDRWVRKWDTHRLQMALHSIKPLTYIAALPK